MLLENEDPLVFEFLAKIRIIHRCRKIHFTSDGKTGNFIASIHSVHLQHWGPALLYRRHVFFNGKNGKQPTICLTGYETRDLYFHEEKSPQKELKHGKFVPSVFFIFILIGLVIELLAIIHLSNQVR